MELAHLFRFVTIQRLNSIIRMQKKIKQIFACLPFSFRFLHYASKFAMFHSIPFCKFIDSVYILFSLLLLLLLLVRSKICQNAQTVSLCAYK